MTDGIKLIEGDCVTVMREFANESIDLTVTSPPYDNLRTYNGYVFDYQATLDELYRITKVGGVVVWVVNDEVVDGSETGTSFRQALYAMETGFNLHDTMIWDKVGCSFPDSKRYHPTFEYMFVFSKGIPKTFNPLCDRKNIYAGRHVHGTFRQTDGTIVPRSSKHKCTVYDDYGRRYNIWSIPNEKHNATGHPAVFPIQIARDHILSWSNEGDIVLDPFMGSGTTGIAAYRTNRKFVGIEISSEYFKIAKNRIEIETAQIRMEF